MSNNFMPLRIQKEVANMIDVDTIGTIVVG